MTNSEGRHPEEPAQPASRRTQGAATPWPQLLRLAAQLGINPEAFWRLSLAEWRALTGYDADVLTRTAFEALAQRFPDEDA